MCTISSSCAAGPTRPRTDTFLTVDRPISMSCRSCRSPQIAFAGVSDRDMRQPPRPIGTESDRRCDDVLERVFGIDQFRHLTPEHRPNGAIEEQSILLHHRSYLIFYRSSYFDQARARYEQGTNLLALSHS